MTTDLHSPNIKEAEQPTHPRNALDTGISIERMMQIAYWRTFPRDY